MTDVLDRLRAIFDDPKPHGLDDKTREVIVDASLKSSDLSSGSRSVSGSLSSDGRSDSGSLSSDGRSGSGNLSSGSGSR